MGNKSYNHHHLHHQTFHHKNANFSPPPPPRTNFLPLLCRVSTKDALNQLPTRRKCPKKDDPSSPKVSCMGQVKRRHTNSNKLLLFPTPPTATASTAKVKYTKLKKIFSGKNLLTTTTSVSCRETSKDRMIDRGRTRSKNKRSNHCHHDNGAVVVPLNLAELDPPLPVVKKLRQPPCCGGSGGEGASLWKRRSGGAGLKGLQIQQFQLPNNSSQFSQPISTV